MPDLKNRCLASLSYCWVSAIYSSALLSLGKTMTTYKNTELIAAFLISIGLSACNNHDTTQNSVQQRSDSASAQQIAAPTAEAADAVHAAGAKLQEYVTCYNKIDEEAHRTITRYASWVKDMNQGPTGDEMNIYGLYSLDNKDIEQCKASFERVAKQSPAFDELDAAALDYASAVLTLAKAVDSVYAYYDREDYKDDNFTKGKQLHGPLADSMQAFEHASAKFSEALNNENDKLLEADLVRIEKEDGRKLPYLHGAMMLHAKKLIRLIEAENFSADVAAMKLSDYEKIADEAIAFKKNNPMTNSGDWSSVERAMEDYRKAAKERIRRIRDKVPYSEGEKMMLTPGSGWMVEGSQEKVVTAYNKLIDASNHLR